MISEKLESREQEAKIMTFIPTHSTHDLVETIMKRVDDTLDLVKEKKEEQQEIRRYDTRMDYSMGFWDGFFYGSTLFSSIMLCAIYYIR